MKIDDRGYSIGSSSLTNGVNGAARNGNGSSKAQSVSGVGGDRADLPGFSALAAAAKSVGAGERADRVEHLRQLVASGQYRIDSQALSRSIVDSALKGE